MKKFDIYLQNVRIRKAAAFIREGDRVLDIGASDGELFQRVAKISEGVGIEPHVTQKISRDRYTLLPGYFPEALQDDRKFDAVVMLAVVEHIPVETLKQMAVAIESRLNPAGRLIITVPDPKVDKILEVLLKFKIIDGMDVDEHYGYDFHQTESIFAVGQMSLLKKKKFQLGLNNLFVFEKSK